MTQRPHKNDISIGPNRWIEFGELAGGWADVVRIDQQLAPVMPFIETLETDCVAGCCGIDAFQLWPESIEKAVAAMGPREREKLASDLASVRGEVERLPCETVVSSRMNQLFRKTVFLEVLTHIRSVVEGIQK